MSVTSSEERRAVAAWLRHIVEAPKLADQVLAGTHQDAAVVRRVQVAERLAALDAEREALQGELQALREGLEVLE